MAKKSKAGRCVHCLKEVDEITLDHVLPKAWYPKSNDPSRKITAPSCLDCNNKLGRIEEDLLLVLSLCLDPNSNLSSGIQKKVLRSINPELGKNDIDRRFRQKRKEALINRITLVDTPPISVFPGFGPVEGETYNKYAIIECDTSLLNSFAEKLIRGVVFYIYDSYIDSNLIFKFYFVGDELQLGFKEKFGEGQLLIEYKKSFRVIRWVAENDPICGVYFVEIWGKLKFFCLLLPKIILNP